MKNIILKVILQLYSTRSTLLGLDMNQNYYINFKVTAKVENCIKQNSLYFVLCTLCWVQVEAKSGYSLKKSLFCLAPNSWNILGGEKLMGRNTIKGQTCKKYRSMVGAARKYGVQRGGGRWRWGWMQLLKVYDEVQARSGIKPLSSLLMSSNKK